MAFLKEQVCVGGEGGSGKERVGVGREGREGCLVGIFLPIKTSHALCYHCREH